MFENIDHIVYAVKDLKSAVAAFSERTGLKIAAGGQHIQYGTKNAIVRIGTRSYLEFIAKDDTLTAPQEGTWMGLDLLGVDKITRWALATTQISSDASVLNHSNAELGHLKEGSRKKGDGSMLKWSMTNVLPSPEVDVVPFLLDWKDSVHPTVGLPLACAIIDFRILTPAVETVSKLMDDLNIRCSVMESEREKIELVLGTPKQQITL